MRRATRLRPAPLLAASVIALLAARLAAQEAAPAGLALTLPGHGLTLAVLDSTDTRITVDASLTDSVRLRFRGDPACLAATGGESVRITVGRCDSDRESDSRLVLAVPPRFAASVEQNGSGDVQAGALGAVSVTLRGSGDFSAAATGPLSLQGTGSGDASVGTVDGPASVRIAGSGDVTLGTVRGPVASERSGSGTISVGSGGLNRAPVDPDGADADR